MYQFIKFLKLYDPRFNPRTKYRIRHIRTDNDGLFTSEEWNQVMDLFHINHVPAPFHEHWLQGKVEKKIQDLRNAANTTRDYFGVPKIFQLYALRIATRANNYQVHSNKTKTPYELMHSEIPDLRFDHIPFCMVYLLTRTKYKEMPRARVGIFLGYNETSQRRRVYECLYISETGRIIILKSVYNPRFNELKGFKDIYPTLSKKYQYMDENNIKNTQSIMEVDNPIETTPINTNTTMNEQEASNQNNNNNSTNYVRNNTTNNNGNSHNNDSNNTHLEMAEYNTNTNPAANPPIVNHNEQHRGINIINEPPEMSRTIDDDIHKWISMREKPKEKDNNNTKKVRKLLNDIIQYNSNDHGRKAITSPDTNELQLKSIFTMKPEVTATRDGREETDMSVTSTPREKSVKKRDV